MFTGAVLFYCPRVVGVSRHSTFCEEMLGKKRCENLVSEQGLHVNTFRRQDRCLHRRPLVNMWVFRTWMHGQCEFGCCVASLAVQPLYASAESSLRQNQDMFAVLPVWRAKRVGFLVGCARPEHVIQQRTRLHLWPFKPVVFFACAGQVVFFEVVLSVTHQRSRACLPAAEANVPAQRSNIRPSCTNVP